MGKVGKLWHWSQERRKRGKAKILNLDKAQTLHFYNRFEEISLAFYRYQVSNAIYNIGISHIGSYHCRQRLNQFQ